MREKYYIPEVTSPNVTWPASFRSSTVIPALHFAMRCNHIYDSKALLFKFDFYIYL